MESLRVKADETVTFSIDGVNYELDLSMLNTSRFRWHCRSKGHPTGVTDREQTQANVTLGRACQYLREVDIIR